MLVITDLGKLKKYGFKKEDDTTLPKFTYLKDVNSGEFRVNTETKELYYRPEDHLGMPDLDGGDLDFLFDMFKDGIVVKQEDK